MGVAPGDEAVLGEQDELRPRVVADGVADLFREGEAGSDVRDPDRLVPVTLAGQVLAGFGAADHVHRIRVRVVHVRVGHEGVQERLDGPPRHVRPQLASRQIRDHLGVVHRVPLHQGQDLVELQPRELPGGYRREIRARPLDPENIHLPPGVVLVLRLRRGVAATVVRHGAIPPEKIRAVGQRLEVGKVPRLFLVPEVLGRPRRLRVHVCGLPILGFRLQVSGFRFQVSGVVVAAGRRVQDLKPESEGRKARSALKPVASSPSRSDSFFALFHDLPHVPARPELRHGAGGCAEVLADFGA